jgi:glutaredoxin 3
MTLKIEIYTMQHCPNCDASKRLLNNRNLSFVAKDVSQEGVLDELKARAGQDVRQMPQIFINDQRVGGYAGLQAALKQIDDAAKPAA